MGAPSAGNVDFCMEGSEGESGERLGPFESDGVRGSLVVIAGLSSASPLFEPCGATELDLR